MEELQHKMRMNASREVLQGKKKQRKRRGEGKKKKAAATSGTNNQESKQFSLGIEKDENENGPLGRLKLDEI